MRSIRAIPFACILLLAMLPMVYAGTVTRYFDSTTVPAMSYFNVTLEVDVVEGSEDFYAIDDVVPPGWEGRIIDEGYMNTSQSGHLKKMNTSKASDTNYTYEMQAPSSPGDHVWSGIFQIDGMASDAAILGSTIVTVTLCTEGARQDCIGIPHIPQNDTGECVYSQETCVGGVWDGICTGGVDAAPESCDGLDSDCDNVQDGSEGLTQNCGPQNQTGLCRFGSQNCNDAGGWDACTGYIDATDEVCPYTPADEDCNGDDQEYRGDVNCDAVVNIADLSAVALEFGTTGVNGDLNGDSIVDIFDLVLVGSRFGATY